MEDDGVDPVQIERFQTVFEGGPDPSASALERDLIRMSTEKETRNVLTDMEARILEKMEQMVQAREDRIIAAITGGKAPPKADYGRSQVAPKAETNYVAPAPPPTSKENIC